MALSQTIDDSPNWRIHRHPPDCELAAVYNEQHRLALEALVSGGPESFVEFLRRERLPCFLSAAELRGILAAAAPPACPLALEESGSEQSAAVDGSSLTYFPEVSDVEPPLLELGWPAFTTGSFRGVTRAVAHFQPAYGDSIYRCKEAVRRMIRSAKEVIAIVTDSLTDLDIFHDLQEASLRQVPVYIVLDQSSLSEFLQMCKSLHVRLTELRHMRVRTITGSTYYLRSGARIAGKVHERFMLIDGNRVATGSYRFNWTDGKLNSSNLIELSGQITESFDEEFRILYAQSLPVNTNAPSTIRNGGIYDHLLPKPLGTPWGRPASLVPACLTSTPNTAHIQQSRQIQQDKESDGRKSSPVSDSSTLGEDWLEQELQQDIIASEEPPGLSPLKAEKVESPISCHSVGVMTFSNAQICHISTQTSPTAHCTVQTEMHLSPPSSSSSSSPRSSSTTSPSPSRDGPAPQMVNLCPPIEGSNLRESFCRLAKERQLHYTTIRSKLEHMMLLLAHRCEPVDVGLSLGSSLHKAYRGSAHPAVEGAFMGTWPRARGLQ
ncbi:protein FAM83D [Pygocentrus nattereri]|uniref:Scaffolding anchor of CK1 domain-containing protein n=1 Tax=Pygocentrus nattereri TaxID=42514 RepID=A0A3B4BU43_PYGNA|nr:protein FAM83D [Pygocentrus nattereri]